MTAIPNYDDAAPIDDGYLRLVDQYANRQTAVSHPLGQTEPVSAVDLIRSKLLTTDQLRALPDPEWLIDGWLVRDSLAVLYGPSTAGKTFGAVDLSLHIATGSWWNGHEVQAGPVIYVIAEGAAGLSKRVDAWQTHHQVHDLNRHQPVRWFPQAVNLTDRPTVEAFAAVAAKLNPALIVFDTLARCIVGADENSARDVGIVVANLDRIRRVTGACVLAVHHTGVAEQNRARGSSALRGAVDTELELTSTDDRRTLKCPKQKDASEPSAMRLALTPAASSCVLIPAGHIVPSGELAASVLETLEALRRVQIPGGVPSGTWKEAATCSPRTYYVHRAQLLKAELVKNLGTQTMPRYVVKDVPTDGDKT